MNSDVELGSLKLEMQRISMKKSLSDSHNASVKLRVEAGPA